MLTLQQVSLVIGILAGSIVLGRFLRSKYSPLKSFASEKIEDFNESVTRGVIGEGDKDWRYRIEKHRGSSEEVSVEDRPYCPKCDAQLKQTRESLLGINHRVTLWKCSECETHYDYEEDESEVVKGRLRDGTADE
ncbi:hypothetical protein [Halobellus litoreus]|uniref:Zn finger protein n=1 Tax=Halobellus litoreus TaxID=755310 RepID=A0ABD6DVQ5_9EURY|nr:hypothetical protein [Halobellus litoreus]